MRVYLAAALTNAHDRHRKDMKTLKEDLNEEPSITVLPWYADEYDVVPEQMPDGAAVLRFNIQQIQKCDVFAPVFAGFGSDGRGIELIRAIDFSKTVAAFKLDGVTTSSMVRGIIQRHKTVSLRTVFQLEEIRTHLLTMQRQRTH